MPSRRIVLIRHCLEILRFGTDSLAESEVLFVSGWCYSRSSSRPVTLELRADGEPLVSVECGGERLDVAKVHADEVEASSLPACGFDMVFFLSDWMRDFELVCPDLDTVLERFQRPESIDEPARGPSGPDSESGSESDVEREISPPFDPYEAFVESNRVRPHVAALLEGATARFESCPVISVLMPVFNADAEFLTAAIESVRGQIYPHWELCIADDASTRDEVGDVLARYREDSRVKVRRRSENGGISRASNSAGELATGEFIALLDHDDMLAENALFEIARALQGAPAVDLIYSDEDKLDTLGRRYDPQFKPDFSPVLLFGYNYINHLTCIRRSVFESVGRFRVGYEGAQDYDLLLRVIDEAREVVHVPKVLYHWRATPQSTASKPEVKPEVKIACDKAIASHVARHAIPARPYQPDLAKRYHLPINQFDWPDSGPSVSIIIPTLDQHELLSKCIESIVGKTSYTNYSITVVDTGAQEKESLRYLRSLADRGIQLLQVPSTEEGFSFSRANNEAAGQVDGEYLLFLNDDCEVREERWLSRMVGHCRLPGVGAVGARLLYPDGTIQHGGVILSTGRIGWPDHAFRGHPPDRLSYYFMAETSREVSAVTAACLLTSRRCFLDQDGFDERRFPVSLNDVDYCLRLAKVGQRTVYVANAVLTHHESMSREKEDDPRELARFKALHSLEDRYYSPSLSVAGDFTVRPECRLDYGEFRTSALEIASFVPSLGLEGAPRILLNAAYGLHELEEAAPSVAAFVDGPLRQEVETRGLPCKVLPLPDVDNILLGWEDEDHLDRCVRAVEEYLVEARPDVVFATVLNCFFVVEAAERAGIPTVWFIQESYPEEAMKANLQPLALARCEAAFAKASRVVFGSEETRDLFRRYDRAGTHSVLYNPLVTHAVETVRERHDRESARQALDLPLTRKILLTVGTVCSRKHQETFVRALSILRRERGGVYGVIVGARAGDPYTELIRLLIRRHGLESSVRLVEETPDVHLYYRAADVFAFSSLIESYSFVILEAMAHGLPIVTTLPPGLREQVRLGVNALAFPFRDPKAMADRLAEVLADEDLERRMGLNSRRMFCYLPTETQAVAGQLSLAYAAWMTHGRETSDWKASDGGGRRAATRAAAKGGESGD